MVEGTTGYTPWTADQSGERDTYGITPRPVEEKKKKQLNKKGLRSNNKWKRNNET